MSFEEEFPKLTLKINIAETPSAWVYSRETVENLLKDVREHCLSKQRVREAWNKLLDATDGLHDLECGECDKDVQEFMKEFVR